MTAGPGDPPTSAGGDERRRPPGLEVRPTTFIVRMSGNQTGVVEHVRTGRKERFEGVDAISRVIAALMGGVEPDGGSAGRAGGPAT